MDRMQRYPVIRSALLVLSLFIFLSPPAHAADMAAVTITEAKTAIDLARKAGAEQRAPDDLSAARSWLTQAEKADEEAKSLLSMIATARMKKAREEEILFFATMARLKAQTAEAKAKRDVTLVNLKNTQKDLADYQNAIAVLKNRMAEAERAREVQALAEVERQRLEEAKQKATALEAQRMKEIDETKRKADALEAQRLRELEESKRKTAALEAQRLKELEEVKRRTAELEAQKIRELAETKRKEAELEALKARELQEARLKEAQMEAAREREMAEAKLKADQLAELRAREAAAMKAKEAKLLAEREKTEALQAKIQAMERERAIISEAGKIPHATVRTGDKKLVITILASNLFSPSYDIKPSGKEILDRLGTLLQSYEKQPVEIRGHSDSRGSQTANQTVSERRAQKVREYLVAYQNILPDRVTAIGVGSEQPVATNETEAGRDMNRRVEVMIFIGE